MKFCNMNLSKALFLVALITLNVLLVPVLSAPAPGSIISYVITKVKFFAYVPLLLLLF